ncbi:MAG: aminopeptidase P family protein [Chlamydiae bacterium CG10_big_fil_rev_8_21_14_0_10_42_34]|nr:MAG: aminopeptidase P family protein [Chlamydiae bacterium CG10_big_fil_rev_8_21_14_0_10_42_34]
MVTVRIQKLMKQAKHAYFIDSPTDLLYLTKMELSKGRLLMGPNEAILFVDGRYFEKAKQHAPCTVALWDEQKKLSKNQIGFDSDTVTYSGYLALKKAFPNVEWTPMPSPLKALRMVKDEDEITALKKAADLTWRGYKKIIECLKEGVSEEELAVEFKVFCLKNGASAFSFEPIIAFGENSAYPHYRAGNVRLKKDQVVLIDIGAVVNCYHADMTRIHYFGKPNPKIERFERIVKAAKQKAIAHVRPGVKVGTLDEIVRAEFEKEGVKQLYTHSLGHGVGLETHEAPKVHFSGEDKDLLLEPGMVFTIEPGLYEPGVGGVRLEDMIVVTETGHENFFKQG